MPKERETYRVYDIEKAKEFIKNLLEYGYKNAYRSWSGKEIPEKIIELQDSLKQLKGLESLQKLYNNLQKTFVEDYNLKKDLKLQKDLQTRLESFQKDMQREKDKDIINECLNISFPPKIVLYKENAISNKDLKVEPSKIEDSAFFQVLFRILGKDTDELKEAYAQDDGDYRTSAQEEINTLFKDTINKRFNELYCLDKEVYEFRILLDSTAVQLSLRKNGDTINLERQSTGFRKFFNLFFNFLYIGEIGKGDIVLIDEPENSLSIPAQRDLRKFLKNFGKAHGILFIIATHSPYMLDIAHLDEVRIVKALHTLESKNTQKLKGSLFINDFSMLNYGESDTLNSIKKALGANIELESQRLVFVEGIMDYNILNAYSEIYASAHKDSIKLLFLPISGVGAFDKNDASNETPKGEPKFTKEQQEKAQNLLDFAKNINLQNPILLVDNDNAGKAMKQGVEKLAKDSQPTFKKLSVITLQEVFESQKGKPNMRDLESLFSKEDGEKFELLDCKENKEASLITSVFKNIEMLKDKLSGESKNNFDALFAYLIDFKNELS